MQYGLENSVSNLKNDVLAVLVVPTRTVKPPKKVQLGTPQVRQLYANEISESLLPSSFVHLVRRIQHFLVRNFFSDRVLFIFPVTVVTPETGVV